MVRPKFGWSALALGCYFTFSPIGARADLPEIGTVTARDQGVKATLADPRTPDVVTRAQFEARGARTVAEALRYLPGVAILRYGGFGATGAVSIDGSNASDQLLVLLNGLPLNLGSTGAADLTTLPLSGIARIELTRGGASTLYGSSAVAGVINLVTSTSNTPNAALAVGSFHDTELRVDDGAPLGGGNVHVALERHTARNSYDFPAAASIGSNAGYPAGTQQNAAAELGNARVTFDQTKNAQLEIHGLLDTGSLQVGVPGSQTFSSPQAGEKINHNLVGLSVIRHHNIATTTAAFSQNDQNLLYRDLGQDIDPNQPSGSFAQDATIDRRTDISIRQAFQYANTRWLTGFEATRDVALINLGLSNLPGGPTSKNAQESQSALYTQVSHTYTNAGKFYVGLRGETDRPQGGALAPAVGGTVGLGAYRLSLNAGSSFRVPTLIDLYYPGFSNPALLPERDRTFDVTLAAPQFFGGLSIGGFARTAHDLIALDASFTPQNIARAQIAGLTASFASPVHNGLQLRGSFTETYRALDLSNPQLSKRLAYVPWSTTTFTLEHAGGAHAAGFGLDGNIYGSTEQYSGGASSGFTTIDSFIELPLQTHAKMTFRVHNIGSERYEIVNGYPVPGRSFEFELATR